MKNNKKISLNGYYKIGEVAKCCDIDRQTIVFYEKMGLIEPSIKNEGTGYRYYSVETVTELFEILQLKRAGFSLAEIRFYMEKGASAAQSVIASIEEKMEALQKELEEAKAISIEKYDYTVSETVIPAMCCFKKEFFARI